MAQLPAEQAVQAVELRVKVGRVHQVEEWPAMVAMVSPAQQLLLTLAVNLLQMEVVAGSELEQITMELLVALVVAVDLPGDLVAVAAIQAEQVTLLPVLVLIEKVPVAAGLTFLALIPLWLQISMPEMVL
jgi:hypothetical protein